MKSEAQGCGACISTSDSIVNSLPSDSATTTLSSHCRSLSNSSMPVSTGYVNGNAVTVLRDTGCSGIVVKRSKVNQSDLTGKTQSCILADGTRIEAPIAKISIDNSISAR